MQAAHLTDGRRVVKGAEMTRALTILAIAAFAGLSACDNTDHTIVVGPNANDPMANAVQNLEDVELPPAIVASDAYRCKDNSLIYIDWFSDDTARIKSGQSDAGTTLTKSEDGSYSGENQTLAGAPTDQTVTVNGQSCSR